MPQAIGFTVQETEIKQPTRQCEHVVSPIGLVNGKTVISTPSISETADANNSNLT